MEQSKSISSAIAKLKIAYPYYFKELQMEDIAGMVSIYQDSLSKFDEYTIDESIKSIICKNKFMPSVSEIVSACEKSLMLRRQNILLKMADDGYFANPYEMEKAIKFIEDDIIPKWFLDDMKKYGYTDISNLMQKDIEKLLEDNND